MSRPALPGGKRSTTAKEKPRITRRPSLTAQRTSKTAQKLVVLPSEPQTKPLLPAPDEEDDDDLLGYETDAGVRVRAHKSEGERMAKAQRVRYGYKRLTAYCVAEEFRMKPLAGFLKREHNVIPRVYDEALYVMYTLPLLPGYGPNANIRSSEPASKERRARRLSEAEDTGYTSGYFSSSSVPHDDLMEPLMAVSPETQQQTVATEAHKVEEEEEHEEDAVAEAIFFSYGVVVFFGFEPSQERSILDDCEGAGAMRRKIGEDDWEVEECHFEIDPNVAHPRIYNDFFTFRSQSHLLKLSVAHALAQSTLLARFETRTTRTLADPRVQTIPQQLAREGRLGLRRREVLKVIGRLFSLRSNLTLSSPVLSVPELFWSAPSLSALYESVRSYLEISSRSAALDAKLVHASGLMGIMHEEMNGREMDRITWIVIWLIVGAILVELGEVVARLVVHATTSSKTELALAAMANTTAMFVDQTVTRENALRVLDNIASRR